MSLEARDVVVRFGGLTALDDVSIEVPDGGFVGLIGPNGAGKTTMFNVLSGFQAPSAGLVRLDGDDVTRLGVSERAARGLGRTFQKLELFGRMSVYDNMLVAAEAGASRLGMAADLLHLPKRVREERRCGEIADAMLERLGLRWAAGQRAADLPVGTARLLELGRALCIGPTTLLLDEPSSGLDPSETASLGALLRDINAGTGVAILLVEHDMDLVMEVCRQIYVLDFGRLIASGDPAAIVADPHVRAAYLGEDDDETAAAPPRG